MVARGDVWWGNLAGLAGRRPVVVIQDDMFNRSGLETTIVAMFTSRLNHANAPGNVLVTAHQSGLPFDSVVNVSQIFTVEKVDLTQRVSTLSPAVMAKIDAGVARILDR